MSQLHTDAIHKYTLDGDNMPIAIEFDHENRNPADPLHSTWNMLTLATFNKESRLWDSNDLAIQYLMSLFGLEPGPNNIGFNYILRDHIDMRQHWVNYWYSGSRFLYNWFRAETRFTAEDGHHLTVFEYIYGFECPDFEELYGDFPAMPQPVTSDRFVGPPNY